jgi:ribosomal protein S18 acetylase RimI-like enzyme
MIIRLMRLADLPQIIPLANQLGYICTLEELTTRFTQLSTDKNYGLFVAESENGAVIAFAQSQEEMTLMTGRRAELNAIVVDETLRGTGVGKKMIIAAEEWARSRGIEKLRLGSRTSRTDSHEFYKKIGFAIDKTWFVFSKDVM